MKDIRRIRLVSFFTRTGRLGREFLAANIFGTVIERAAGNGGAGRSDEGRAFKVSYLRLC